MYCNKCGAEIKVGEAFCGKCGAPVSMAASPTEVSRGGGQPAKPLGNNIGHNMSVLLRYLAIVTALIGLISAILMAVSLKQAGATGTYLIQQLLYVLMEALGFSGLMLGLSELLAHKNKT